MNIICNNILIINKLISIFAKSLFLKVRKYLARIRRELAISYVLLAIHFTLELTRLDSGGKPNFKITITYENSFPEFLFTLFYDQWLC